MKIYIFFSYNVVYSSKQNKIDSLLLCIINFLSLIVGIEVSRRVIFLIIELDVQHVKCKINQQTFWMCGFGWSSLWFISNQNTERVYLEQRQHAIGSPIGC